MSASKPEIDDYFRDFCGLMEQASNALSEEDYMSLLKKIKSEI